MNRRKGKKRKTTTTRTAAAISIHTSLQAISEGKTLIQVAVALNAKESEVTRFYKEYLKLNQMHDLSIVYQELKGDITPFLKLYRSAKAAGMSEQHVVNLLMIANSIDNDNNNLPAVEHRYQKLKQEVNSLEIRKLNSNRTLQDLRKQILTLRKALDFCVLTQITNRKNIRTPFTFYAYFL